MHLAESSSTLFCLWTGLSLPVALHPVSQRRSYLPLRTGQCSRPEGTFTLIGVGTKVGFAPPSEPDWQFSCIRLSSWWLTFKKISRRILLNFKVRSVVVSLTGVANRLSTRVEGSRTCFCSSPN